MGLTRAEVRVYNPVDLAKFESIELLVNSGAIFTSLPRTLLEKLGLKPVDRRKLEVYGGTILERDVGGAVIEYGDKRAVVPLIFGEPKDTPVLGATALEALGYQLDPVTKKLIPAKLLMI